MSSAVEQSYTGLLHHARVFLTEASRDRRAGHDALAQTQIDLAQRLLDLTPMIFRVINCAAPLDTDWDAWRKSLDLAADVTRWPSASTVLEMRARHFLERMLAVRWGNADSMQAPLPVLRRVDAARTRINLETHAVAANRGSLIDSGAWRAGGRVRS